MRKRVHMGPLGIRPRCLCCQVRIIPRFRDVLHILDCEYIENESARKFAHVVGVRQCAGRQRVQSRHEMRYAHT